ncbi:hypothetical protein [Catenuloplanes indicus]|uniref:Uncharacterized protein n=1 Tax=Catenuloplanes indicus TaxID=137267 RepID=A0AAE3W5H1_9ACTN|nr:hypothetical protein [Catenuloplanes indicus]MDQ0369791.1 hypothetical protein [Catenuloplanes indicus]
MDPTGGRRGRDAVAGRGAFGAVQVTHADDDMITVCASRRRPASRPARPTTLRRAIGEGPAEPELVPKAFVDRLNALDERHGMIDTIRREAACAAFDGLATRAGITPEQAGTLCDEWREW